MKVVVFVDDSKTVLLSAETAMKPLTDAGSVQLVLYSDPLELLEDCRNGMEYDLVITDVNMPQMSGLEMAKELKALEHLKLKPILALTTENSDDIKQHGKEIGLMGWLVKPFSPDKLVMGTKRALRLR